MACFRASLDFSVSVGFSSLVTWVLSLVLFPDHFEVDADG